MYRIKIDRSRCIGCLTCVTACVVSHETESGDARNRVTIDSETKPAPIFCRHCERPECVFTCMTGAMKKNPVTGYVEYDKEQCASCYMCIMSCPYGVLKYDSIRHKDSFNSLVDAVYLHQTAPPQRNERTITRVWPFAGLFSQ